MTTTHVLGACFLATLLTIGQGPDGVRNFKVAVPAATGGQPLLLLSKVTTPANRSAILRAYVLIGPADSLYLGSTSIVAIAPMATGITKFERLTIALVPRAAQWLTAQSPSDTLTIVVVPVTGQRGVIRDLRWFAAEARLIRAHEK